MELLAGVPSVVYGFFALFFITPKVLNGWLNLEVTFTNTLAAGLVLGVMIIPTIASLAEDALSAVPVSLRQGSFAMGANRMQTTLRVVLPAALSGVAAAIVLGMSRAVGETMIVAMAGGAVKNMSVDPREPHQTMTAFIAQTAQGENPVGSTSYNMLFAVALLLFLDHLRDQRDQHLPGASIPAGVLMSVATTTASAVTKATLATGRSKDRSVGSVVFLGALWFSLFFGVAVLMALIIDTMISGSSRFDADLFTMYESTIHKDSTGFRAGILGSIWLMITTALLAIPLGIATALYLEEFADRNTWYNRLVEVNLQNLAAVPAIIYGMLAAAIMGLLGYSFKGIVLGGAIALALLILPVVIITTREAVRAVPQEIRQGSLALGATVWQTTWKQTLPSAIPGIATGTDPRPLQSHRRGGSPAHPGLCHGAVRPDQHREQGQRAPSADLQPGRPATGSIPDGRFGGDHPSPGHGPDHERPSHISHRNKFQRSW